MKLILFYTVLLKTSRSHANTVPIYSLNNPVRWIEAQTGQDSKNSINMASSILKFEYQAYEDPVLTVTVPGGEW